MSAHYPLGYRRQHIPPFSVYLSMYPITYLPNHLSVCTSICIYIYTWICLSVYTIALSLIVCLSNHPYMSICLYTPPFCLSIYIYSTYNILPKVLGHLWGKFFHTDWIIIYLWSLSYTQRHCHVRIEKGLVQTVAIKLEAHNSLEYHYIIKY